MKKFGLDNIIYIEADSRKAAIKKFWELMEKAGIGGVLSGDPVPNCFVNECECFGKLPNKPHKSRRN